MLAAAGRRRRALPLPLTGLRAALRAEETLAGPTALVTWDEAQLLAVEMLSETGTAGAEALGVSRLDWRCIAAAGFARVGGIGSLRERAGGAPRGAPLRSGAPAGAAGPR